MKTHAKQFQRGQKVVTIYGERFTVLRQLGCQVWIAERPCEWYHPSKLFSI